MIITSFPANISLTSLMRIKEEESDGPAFYIRISYINLLRELPLKDLIIHEFLTKIPNSVKRISRFQKYDAFAGSSTTSEQAAYFGKDYESLKSNHP